MRNASAVVGGYARGLGSRGEPCFDNVLEVVLALQRAAILSTKALSTTLLQVTLARERGRSS